MLKPLNLGTNRARVLAGLVFSLAIPVLMLSNAHGSAFYNLGGFWGNNCKPSMYHLSFSTQPSSSVTLGSSLAQGPVVQILNSNNAVVTTGPLSTATITLYDGSKNGGLGGTITEAAVAGVATFPNSSITFERGGTTSLTAAITSACPGVFTVTSNSITVTIPSLSNVGIFSGIDNPNGDVNGTGTAAKLFYPGAMTYDGTYVYIMESAPACVIRRYQVSNGAVTTWTGQLYNCGATDGAVGTNTIDPSQNVDEGLETELANDGTYVYFVEGNAIRRAQISNGTITTIAGSVYASGGYLDNTTGTSAQFNAPMGIYIRGTTLYVGDMNNYRIRAVSLTSPFAVTTVVGNGTAGYVDNSNPLSAEIQSPGDNNSQLYLTGDSTYLYFNDNGYIRRYAWSGGAVSTAQTPSQLCGNIWFPLQGMAVNGTTMYVVCQNYIQSATIGTWTWTTIAGSQGIAGDVDGSSSSSLIGAIQNADIMPLVVGTSLYFADTENGALRAVNSSNVTSTLAGPANGGTFPTYNTTATSSRFEHLIDAISDGTNLWVGGYDENNIAQIALSNGSTSNSQIGFYTPQSPIFASLGNTLYSFSGDCTIYSLNTTAYTATSVVGAGCGEAEGSFSTALFTGIDAIASDHQNNLYVLDNRAIKKINFLTKTVSVLSGTPGSDGCTLGTAAASQYDGTNSMIYLNGKLYFSQQWCNYSQIVQVDTTTGASVAYAGNGTANGLVNGSLSGAEFGFYGGSLMLATDGVNIYVDDVGNGVIREINVGAGTISTVFGSSNQRRDVDAAVASAYQVGALQGGYLLGQSIYYGFGKLYIVEQNGVRYLH